jgi:hypothetical protein
VVSNEGAKEASPTSRRMPPRCQFQSGFSTPRDEESSRPPAAGAARAIPAALPPSPPTKPPTPPSSSGGYGNLKRGGGGGGGYGKLANNKAPEVNKAPKVYPKSANFARMPTGLELEEGDVDTQPQSARAAVRSWSATGGMREATFKKRPASREFSDKRRPNSAVGFASILNLADQMAVDDPNEDVSVAMIVEELIVQVENEGAGMRPWAEASVASLSVGRLQPRHATLALPSASTPAADGSEPSDSRRSVDLDALSASKGYATRDQLAVAPASQTTMAAVLSTSHAADELATALGDNAAPSDESDDDVQPPIADPAAAAASAADTAAAKGARGGYGNLRKGSPPAGSPGPRLASWSDSGGLREATFKHRSHGSSLGSLDNQSDELG